MLKKLIIGLFIVLNVSFINLFFNTTSVNASDSTFLRCNSSNSAYFSINGNEELITLAGVSDSDYNLCDKLTNGKEISFISEQNNNGFLVIDSVLINKDIISNGFSELTLTTNRTFNKKLCEGLNDAINNKKGIWESNSDTTSFNNLCSNILEEQKTKIIESNSEDARMWQEDSFDIWGVFRWILAGGIVIFCIYIKLKK